MSFYWRFWNLFTLEHLFMINLDYGRDFCIFSSKFVVGKWLLWDVALDAPSCPLQSTNNSAALHGPKCVSSRNSSGMMTKPSCSCTRQKLHPPKADHINMHQFCLHLWRSIAVPIPLPPSILVGVK